MLKKKGPRVPEMLKYAFKYQWLLAHGCCVSYALALEPWNLQEVMPKGPQRTTWLTSGRGDRSTKVRELLVLLPLRWERLVCRLFKENQKEHPNPFPGWVGTCLGFKENHKDFTQIHGICTLKT